MNKRTIFQSTAIWLRLSWLKFPCDDLRFSLGRELCLREYSIEKAHFIITRLVNLLKPFEKPFEFADKNETYYGNLLCDLNWVASKSLPGQYIDLCRQIRHLLEC